MRRCCRLQRRSQHGTAAPLVPCPRVTPLWREQLQRGRRRAICRGQQRVCQRVAERGAGGAQRGARAAHGRAGSRGAATQHTLHATQAAQPRWLRRRARATSEGVRRCLLGTLACRPALLLLCGIQAACSAPRRPLCATRSPHQPTPAAEPASSLGAAHAARRGRRPNCLVLPTASPSASACVAMSDELPLDVNYASLATWLVERHRMPQVRVQGGGLRRSRRGHPPARSL